MANLVWHFRFMKQSALSLAILASLAFTTPARAQDAPSTATFADNFAFVDETRWRVADGWNNGDWISNDWRRSQVRRTPTGIDITLARARSGDKPYSSGELQSDDVYRYGYFEVRMQAPRGSGLVTGFFTYTRPGGENTWDEIDIEILGRNTRALQMTYFRRGRRHITTMRLPFDAADGQHIYAFEWTQRYIRWYVDGRLFHEETGANGPLPQAAQRLYINLWNSSQLTDWLGPIRPAEAPWRLSVSCIARAQRYEGRSLCAEVT